MRQDNVIAFRPKNQKIAALKSKDQRDIDAFRSRAMAAGYDRLELHALHPSEGLPVANYVSASRRGEAWSRWGFARDGDVVKAWSTLSSKDAGTFSTLLAAFECVLLGGCTILHRAG